MIAMQVTDLKNAVAALNIELVQHGVNGWELTDADWSARTGVMQLDYEREVSPGVIETCIRFCKQPAQPGHIGWFERHQAPAPFALAV